MTAATVAVLNASDLRALLATPPPGFVAERNALVKRLRVVKQRASAAAVSSIRRPAWPEWALNVTSQSDPDDIEAFAVAAAAVRDAQAAAIEGRPADVRHALAQLRDCTANVTRLANAALRGEGRPEGTPQLRALLSQVASDPDVVELLRRGVLGSAEEAATDQFADLNVALRPPRAERPSPSTSGRRRDDSAEPAPRREPEPPAVSAAERRELMRALATAERELQHSQRALTKAEAAVDDAADVVTHAEERLVAARQVRDDASAVVTRDGAARDEAAVALDAAS